MENNSNKKTNLLELESLRSELIEKTLETTSNNLRLFHYQSYFEKVLSLDNANYNEAFLNEFRDDYHNSIQKFEIFGTNPEFTDKLLQQLKKLITLSLIKENHSELISEIERIEKQKQKLAFILEGKEYEGGIERKAFFPVIDTEAPSDFYGTLESITVRINKAVDADRFIIVPSEKEIEKRISEQCRRSWLLALSLSKKYVKKPFKYHEIIISFDKREAFYEGNSFGIALTLTFLEQLLQFYNPAYIIKIKEQSAFTGGVMETGEVLSTSEEIIKRKVTTVFFSEINAFVFPKCGETYAFNALTHLKNTYPNRKLKLIPVEEIDDVTNRRDLVEVKKISPVIRSGKFVKKNWISAVTTVLLAILFAYLFVMDFDDNPAILEIYGNELQVKNRNGKILWTTLADLPRSNEQSVTPAPHFAKIVDIDEDNVNEIILIREIDPETLNLKNYSTITCFNNKGIKIWEYTFLDTIHSKRERLNNNYSVTILDILNAEGNKILYSIAASISSFPSAIYKLDLKTGKRLTGTFWASGIITEGIIKDIDNDSIKEIVGIGYDNGFEDVVLFAINIDSMTRVRPTTEEYLIKNHPIALIKSYILFPKNDYEIYSNMRTSFIGPNSFTHEQKRNKFKFATCDPSNYKEAIIGYEIDSLFKDIDIIIGSGFRVKRDSLVKKGKLNLPNTDTEEYKEILKKNILYWRDGEWVKRDGLE